METRPSWKSTGSTEQIIAGCELDLRKRQMMSDRFLLIGGIPMLLTSLSSKVGTVDRSHGRPSQKSVTVN